MDIEMNNIVAQLVLTLGYVGTQFAGFAPQPEQRTVAGEVNHALSTILRRPVELVCAGRTDAGVHALGQVVSVGVTAAELERIQEVSLLKSLSALCGDDISFYQVGCAPANFSARFDACMRHYRYLIVDGPARPVLLAPAAWDIRTTLDEKAMDAAAQVLIGEHDFKSFCKAQSALDKSTCRYIDRVTVRRLNLAEPVIAVEVWGNAFLHNMVRIMVGSLVEVGRGARDAAWLKAAREGCNRALAGPTAPPQGLAFMDVRYPADIIVPWEERLALYPARVQTQAE